MLAIATPGTKGRKTKWSHETFVIFYGLESSSHQPPNAIAC
jgi:hypothetical protein